MSMKIFTLTSFVILAANINLYAQSWWPQTSNTQINLMDIGFDDPFTGYAFGDSLSTIVKTTNQGFTWTPLSPTFQDANLQAGAVISNLIVVAAGIDESPGGTGVVLRTTNGGSTWTTDVTVPEKIFGIHFPTANEGWICGENGYIGRSTDGGINWLQLTTGTGEDFHDVHFINTNEGWAVGTGDPISNIFHTTDGGTSWTSQNSGIVDDPLNGVFFLDANTGWACGDAGNILVTADGGSTWNPQTSGTTQDLNNLQFLDANNGWCVGSGGIVLKTTDGGVTWTAETSGTSQDIFGIQMINTTLGWFSGDGGTIHVYGMNPPNSISESTEAMLISAYPNPVRDIVTLDLTGTNLPVQVEIIGMDGRIMESHQLNASVNQINMTHYASGIYLIKATSNEEGITRTLIITRN